MTTLSKAAHFLQSPGLPIGAYLLAVGAITLASVHRNDGHLVYLADDPYIHMAMAKNTVLHGVWGVSRHAFSSSSSSPLWTALLALSYSVAGVNSATPLLLNAVFGLLTLVTIHRIYARYTPALLPRFAVLLPCLLILVFYTFYGMESVLQSFLVVVFVYLSTKALVSREERSWHSWSLLAAFFAAATRYENLIPIGVVCLIYLVRRRWRSAVRLGFVASLPVLAYGLLSVANGWHFLPNTVLLKSGIGHLTVPGFLIGRDPGVTGLSLSPAFLFAVCLVLLAWLIRRRTTWDERRWLLVIFLASAFGHAMLARLSGPPVARYDAYLMFLGLIAAVGPGFELLRSFIFQRISASRMVRTLAISSVVLAYCAGFALAGRLIVRIVRRVTTGTSNIYQQQYQMARFVRTYYQGKTVALNDIGAVSFYVDARVLDLYGLASLEVAEMKLRGAYGTQQIDLLSRKYGVDVVIAYEEWFSGGSALPPQWVRVGTWRIENNLACGGDTVSILATDPEKVETIAANLREFSATLPQQVIQDGAYLGDR